MSAQPISFDIRRRRRPSKAHLRRRDFDRPRRRGACRYLGIGFTPLLAERTNCRRRDPLRVLSEALSGGESVVDIRGDCFSQFLKPPAYAALSSSVELCESTMTEPMRPRVKYVIGPDGSPLTIADLPPMNTRRWVIRRKAEVVAAVRGGLLSLEEACQRYTLTVDEFLSWQMSIDQHGLAGLRTTRIQHYRQ